MSNPSSSERRFSAPSTRRVEADTSVHDLGEPNPDASSRFAPDLPAPTPDNDSATPETRGTEQNLLPPYHEMSVHSLSNSYRVNPESDHGISGVLDDITMNLDERERQGDDLVLGYERDIIDFARSEAVRLHEDRVNKDIDFSLNNDPFGRLRAAAAHIGRGIASETDDLKRQQRQASVASINNYIARHETTESAADRQALAINLYQISKELDATPQTHWTEEQLAKQNDATKALKDRTFDVAGTHGDYTVASANFRSLPDSFEEEETDDTPYGKLKRKVALTRTDLAALHAKGQKRLFNYRKLGRNRAEIKEADEKTHDDYHNAVQALIAHEFKEKLASTDRFDETEQNYFIAMRTVDEAKALDKEVIDHYSKNDTRMGKFLNWWTGRDENGNKRSWKEMSGKSKAARVIKIASIPGIAIASAATGGAFGIALASGMWASGNLYANLESRGREKRISKDPGLLKMDKVQNEFDRQNYERFAQGGVLRDDAIEAKSMLAAHLINKAANKETSKYKRRIGYRLGIAAAAGVGVKIGVHEFGQWIGGDTSATEHPGGGEGGETEGQAPGQTPPTEKPEITITPEEVPGAPHTTPDIPAPTHEFAPGTFYAHNGDGFYQILENMGVDASHRDDVLARASHELYSKGLAYRMGDGLPGIPRPGYLSQNTIDVLMRAAGK